MLTLALMVSVCQPSALAFSTWQANSSDAVISDSSEAEEYTVIDVPTEETENNGDSGSEAEAVLDTDDSETDDDDEYEEIIVSDEDQEALDILYDSVQNNPYSVFQSNTIEDEDEMKLATQAIDYSDFDSFGIEDNQIFLNWDKFGDSDYQKIHGEIIFKDFADKNNTKTVKQLYDSDNTKITTDHLGETYYYFTNTDAKFSDAPYVYFPGGAKYYDYSKDCISYLDVKIEFRCVPDDEGTAQRGCITTTGYIGNEYLASGLRPEKREYTYIGMKFWFFDHDNPTKEITNYTLVTYLVDIDPDLTASDNNQVRIEGWTAANAEKINDTSYTTFTAANNTHIKTLKTLNQFYKNGSETKKSTLSVKDDSPYWRVSRAASNCSNEVVDGSNSSHAVRLTYKRDSTNTNRLQLWYSSDIAHWGTLTGT